MEIEYITINGELFNGIIKYCKGTQGIVEANCKNGKFHGEHKEYWSRWHEKNDPKDINVLQSKCTYINGKKDGYFIDWFSSGTIERSGTLKDGRLHGEWKNWNRKGELGKHFFYKEGIGFGQQKENSNVELERMVFI